MPAVVSVVGCVKLSPGHEDHLRLNAEAIASPPITLLHGSAEVQAQSFTKGVSRTLHRLQVTQGPYHQRKSGIKVRRTSPFFPPFKEEAKRLLPAKLTK